MPYGTNRRACPCKSSLPVLDRLDTADYGIILLHDTKTATAAMLPAFLRALKILGYHIVHTVPKTAAQ
jgi:peptidoglycan-N-acetylglucosamine deacetylase